MDQLPEEQTATWTDLMDLAFVIERHFTILRH